MPTYQYTCTDCGQPLEAVQKFSDAGLTECPACGGRLRKVFSAVGVVFKGSGFYRNDSRSAAASGKGGSDGAKESVSATTGGTTEGTNGSKRDSTSESKGKSEGKSDGGGATTTTAPKVEGSRSAA